MTGRRSSDRATLCACPAPCMAPTRPSLLDERCPLPLTGPSPGARGRLRGRCLTLLRLATLAARSGPRAGCGGSTPSASCVDTHRVPGRGAVARRARPARSSPTARRRGCMDRLLARRRCTSRSRSTCSAPEVRLRARESPAASGRCADEDVESSVACASPAGRGPRWTSGRLLPRYDAIGALDAFLRAGVPRHELEWGVHAVQGLARRRPAARPGAARRPTRRVDARSRRSGCTGTTAGCRRRHRRCGSRTTADRVDLGIPEIRYGAEYLGEAFHAGEEQREARRGADGLVEASAGGSSTGSGSRHLRPHADPAAVMREGVRRGARQLRDWRPQGKFLT